MDTKLKADVAEFAVTTELLRRGFNVLKPIGDRLSYDLAIDQGGQLKRLQIKCAWYSQKKDLYIVDVRRTRTNRRLMKRKRYSNSDFDYAILFLANLHIFYIMPIHIFNSYTGSLAIVEGNKRQRPPRSAGFKERWDLLERGPFGS